MHGGSIQLPANLSRIDVIPYALPFAAAYTTARGSLSHRELVLIRLHDEEGRTGLGEGVPLTLRGGNRDRVTAELDRWAGWALTTGALEWRTGSPIEAGPDRPIPSDLSSPARIAVLTALADLEAKRRDLPLWALLGTQAAEPVPCNATLVSGSADEVAADAERWAAKGFSTFKMKVGLDREPLSPTARDRDLAQVSAVRERLGPGFRIRLDANGAWSLERARQAIEAASEHGIELVEQPVSDLYEMARLNTQLKGAVKLAADESVTSPETARLALDLGACEAATVKLSKTGRLDPVLDDRLLVYLSSALDGPVGIAAAAHCHQILRERSPAAGSLAQGLATQLLFAATVASRQCELDGHLLYLPDGPGLGVELDLDLLARYATRSFRPDRATS